MKRILLTLVLVLTLLGLFAAPAEAHTTTIYQGNDWARVYDDAQYYGHYRIRIADRECDGHDLFVEVILSPDGDNDGIYHLGGCGAANDTIHWFTPHWVHQYRLCEIRHTDYGIIRCKPPRPYWKDA